MWKQRLTPYVEGYTVVLCEGFVMYWDQAINEQFDVRFLLREEYDLLLKRRNERNGYVHTSLPARRMLISRPVYCL
jgi:uridine kinase